MLKTSMVTMEKVCRNILPRGTSTKKISMVPSILISTTVLKSMSMSQKINQISQGHSKPCTSSYTTLKTTTT